MDQPHFGMPSRRCRQVVRELLQTDPSRFDPGLVDLAAIDGIAATVTVDPRSTCALPTTMAWAAEGSLARTTVTVCIPAGTMM